MRWKWNKSAFGPPLLFMVISCTLTVVEGASVEKRSVSSCKRSSINWDNESQSAQCINEDLEINESCSRRDNWPEQTVAEIRCNKFWRSQSNPDSKVTNICLNGKWEEEPNDKNLKCEVICGIAGESAFDSLHIRSRSGHANLRKRSPLLKGNWPWHVGIYTEDIPGSGDFRYSCGGTLISTRAILTAAQCVTYRQQPSLELKPSMVKIATGSFKLLYGERINETIEPVEKIVLNPYYNHTVYGADLAIIWLHNYLHVSPYVHPVCLPRADQDDDEIKLNELGKLVVLRNRTFEETHVPTMDLQKCRESSTTHSLLAHSASFCTRSNNDPSVCTHTAGVGLAFEYPNPIPVPNPVDDDSDNYRSKPSHSTTRWTIQGVRSGVLNLNQDCSKPIIFTKVSKFLKWINHELKNREPPMFPKIIAATAKTIITTTTTKPTTEKKAVVTTTEAIIAITPRTTRITSTENYSLNPTQTQITYTNKTESFSVSSTRQKNAKNSNENADNAPTRNNSRTSTQKPKSKPNPSPVYIQELDDKEGTIWNTSRKPMQIQTTMLPKEIEEHNNYNQFNGLSINDNNGNLKHRNSNQPPRNKEQGSSSTESVSSVTAFPRSTFRSIIPSFSSEESLPAPPPKVSTKNREDKETGTELHGTQLEDWEKDVGFGEISNSKSRSTSKRPVLEIFASSTKSTLSASVVSGNRHEGNNRDRESESVKIVEDAIPITSSLSSEPEQLPINPGLRTRQSQSSHNQGLGPRVPRPSYSTTTVITEMFPIQISPENIRKTQTNLNHEEAEVGIGGGTMTVQLKSVTCPAIRASEGVQLQCRHDKFEETEKDNCMEGGSPGSKATYTCEKFYKSVYGTISVQQNCTERGSWFPTRDFGCKIECGISSRPKISYIVNGVISDRVSWPWHATVFKRNAVTNRLEYHCGGTLISKSVIITAAHCITYPRTTNKINEEFVILLAAISSNFTLNRYDTHTRKYKVKKLFVPETYNPLTFESDIALIQLEEDVKLTDYTKPICWPSKNNIEYSNLESVHLEHGSRGYTVGFGIDETGELGYELKETALPYVTHKDCRAALDRLPTSTQFCAGYRNGTGTAVCNGDSGGGIYFLDDSNTAKRFILQGIISNGDPKENSKFCNSNNYAVFTKVSSFSSWIEPILDIIDEERRYAETEAGSVI